METPVPGWFTSAIPNCAATSLKVPSCMVAIEMVPAAGRAVGDIDIGPAIAIEIDDRYGGAHRGDLGHDACQLGVERRRLMHEMDAGLLRDLLQMKAITRQSLALIELCLGLLLPRGNALDDQREWLAARRRRWPARRVR